MTHRCVCIYIKKKTVTGVSVGFRPFGSGLRCVVWGSKEEVNRTIQNATNNIGFPLANEATHNQSVEE